MVQWISQDFAGGAELNEKIKKFELYKSPVTRINHNDDDACPNTCSIARKGFSPKYKLGDFTTKENGENFGTPHFIKGENDKIIGLEVGTLGFSFYAPLFPHREGDKQEIEKVKAALKLNLARVTEYMEGYISHNQNNLDQEAVSKNCQDCREVLNLIAPKPV